MVPKRWSARNAIIGEWSISPLLWLVSMPFIVVVQYGRLEENFDWNNAQLLAISAFGQVVALAVLLAARLAGGGRAGVRERSLIAVFLTWFIAGGAAGAVTVLILERLRLFNGPRGFVVVILMGMTTIAIYSLVSFTIGVLRGHREEVDTLREYRDVLVLRNQESGAFADDQQRLLRAALDEEVLPAFRDLGERVESLSYRPHQEELEQLRLRVVMTSESIARRIDEGIDSAVQDRRAHRLSRIARGGRTDGGWMSILLGSSVPAYLGCLIVVLFAFMERVRGCLAISFIMMIGMILVVLAGAAVRRYTSGEPPGARLAVGAATLGSLILVYWGATRVEIAGCAWTGSTELFIASACTLIGALVFAGVSVEADRQLRLMGRELSVANDATRVAIASLDEAGRTLRDHVSDVLNGVLQGRLGAVAMALQSHLNELNHGGHPSSERLVADVTALLRLADQDMEEILTRPLQPVPLDEALLILRVRWAGLLAIDWEIDDGAQARLDDDPSLLRWASEVIDHSVSDASRLGSATAVRIRVSDSEAAPGWLRIRLRDNGTGPSNDATEGAAAARAVTERGGTWELTSGEQGGAELTVELPGARWSSDASHGGS
jgi:hypothetical protein